MSRQTKLAVCVRRSMAQRLLFQCLVVVTSAALVGGSFAVIEAAPSAVQASDGTSSDTAADAANTGLESIQSSPGVTSGPVPEVSATLVETNTWPMAGANPQRTSWSPEQVPSVAYMAANRQTWNNGMLYPQWAKPIQPYISHKVQVIAANSTLYISTARGLYALNSDTGAVRWVYPTELPLGNAPTIYGNVAYVGGLDKKIHAINALTGEGLWTFEATQGFETNPLVVNGILYAGNRDGALYAIDVNTHQLAWKYQTGGPILFSAAYTTTASYPGGVVYFASNDNYAYAVNAQTSALVWQSAKLPSAGFQSWWPVVYGNVVVFVGASSYRDVVRPGPTCQCNIDALDRDGVFPNAGSAPKGTPVGARINGGEWLDATAIRTYLQNYPQRRTYFVLNRDSGSEGTPYAPILWFGTQSGTRYPPLVGSDGNLYQTNDFLSAPTVNGGGISGWQYGTTNISQPAVTWFAIDEPLAYSAGGNIIYWSLSGNQAAGAFDISVPNTRFWSGGNQPLVDAYREWAYWSYDLNTRLPDYDVAYGGTQEFGGINGIYDRSDQNAPIPYKGKVYLIQGNAVIALGMTNPSPSILPMAATVPVAETTAAVDQNLLRQKLAAEVQKMITAGHLRPV
jgi:outer membrane protein assembly factor BamB